MKYVYIHYSSGIVGGNITRSSPAASPVKRLMNCYGGSLNQYGSYPRKFLAPCPYTYGSNDGNSTSDIETVNWWSCSAIIRLGNAHERRRHYTVSGAEARERSNARMIVIDRYTDTAAGREDGGYLMPQHRRRAGGEVLSD